MKWLGKVRKFCKILRRFRTREFFDCESSAKVRMLKSADHHKYEITDLEPIHALQAINMLVL
jgi:hypothetical protein